MIKAALYRRASEEEKDLLRSLENQLTDGKRFIDAMGFEFYKDYRDVHSGYRDADSREGFGEMMVDARARRFDVLVVTKMSRFSREAPTKAFAQLDELTRRLGIRFIAFKEGIDSTSPAWEIIMAAIAWQANNYSHRLSQDIRRGIERKKRLGTYKGGRPRVPKKAIADIKRLASEGLSIRQIRARVTYRTPTGKIRNPSIGKISEILKSNSK